MHVLFGSVTGFDFSFGNYRSITRISFLYFVFERGSSVCFYFFLALRAIWKSVVMFSSFLLMQQFSFTPIFVLFLFYFCVNRLCLLFCVMTGWRSVISVREKDSGA